MLNDLDIDQDGSVYVSDMYTNRIYRVVSVALHVKSDKMPELKRETFTA
jgi:sugar lactone lactonase YvrE